MGESIRINSPDNLAQSVTSLVADPEAVSSIPVWPHTFEEIAHEFSTVILLLRLIPEGQFSVTSDSMFREYRLTA